MDQDKLNTMGRRRFMKNLAALGVSAPAIAGLSQAEVSEYDLESEVPYVKAYRTVEKQPGEAPVREPVYDTIDREEWERRETALD
ncbi:MAG: twin-arginine translocation signal domain-containing protein, partial [Candidatus Nanohaloarchaea archaeon]